MRRKSRKKGFTLVELLVAFGISVGIVGLMVVMLRMGRQSWQVEQGRMAVSSELRRGIDAMGRELAETQDAQLDIPADGNWYESVTFRIPEDVDGDGTVLDDTGAIEWSPETITYELGGDAGDQLVRTQDTDTRVMANGVTDIQFRRAVVVDEEGAEEILSNVVEIQIAVERGSNTGDFPNNGTLTTTVRLRN